MHKLLLCSWCVMAIEVSAKVPTPVKTAIKNVGKDMSTIGWLLIGLAAVAMGVRWIRAQFF